MFRTNTFLLCSFSGLLDDGWDVCCGLLDDGRDVCCGLLDNGRDVFHGAEEAHDLVGWFTSEFPRGLLRSGHGEGGSRVDALVSGVRKEIAQRSRDLVRLCFLSERMSLFSHFDALAFLKCVFPLKI